MAGPSSVNIIVSVKNQASAPLKQVKKDFTDLRGELVKFNRNLFTASAVYASFSQGFARAFKMAELGAQFDFFREQFNKTYGSSYLTTLRTATQGTMDATSMMQVAIQNHARGLKKAETEKVFGLSVGAAKLLGTSTADAAKRMSHALAGLSVSGMQSFFVALNTNNQFKNMGLIMQRLTKGLNMAGRNTELFRKTALAELTRALGEVSASGGDALTMFMMMRTAFSDMQRVVGAFISRALAPLLKKMATGLFSVFDRLNAVLDDTKKEFDGLRKGLVDFIQVGGGFLISATAIAGALSLMGIAAATLGVSFGNIFGLFSLFAIGMRAIKGPSDSWLETLANIGVVLKFVWQAFSTYKNGVSTFSRDVTDRISGMSEKSQNRILLIAKAFVLAREAIDGFVDGVKTTFNYATKIAAMFGLWDTKTKQFTESTAFLANNLGKVAGILATLFVAKKGLGAVLGGVGGVLGKIPGIGNVFQRGASAANPLWVQSVDSALGAAGGLGASANILKGIGAVLGVAGAGVAGYQFGTFLNDKLGLSDSISNLGLGANSGEGAAKSSFNFPSKNNVLNSTLGGAKLTESANLHRNELSSLIDPFQQAGGTFDTKQLQAIAQDQVITEKEMVEILKSMRNYLREKTISSGKSNSVDQVVR